MGNRSGLDGPRAEPASGGKARQLVVMLHGVGADGHDLIDLADYFGEVLPDAAFVAPNAPFAFDMAAFGYQWFSLSDLGPTAVLDGVRRAASILDTFLDDELAALDLTLADLALVGFSQGTMMSLHVSLRREKPVAGVLGYSGRLAGAESLAQEVRARPPVRLIHGDSDDILPVRNMHEAVAALTGMGVPIDSFVRPGLGHGIDGEGVRLGQEFLAGLFA